MWAWRTPLGAGRLPGRPFSPKDVEPVEMQHTVEPLDSARFPEAAALLGRAFQNDPVVASILPGTAPETRLGKLSVMFEEMLRLNARRNQPIGIVDAGSVRAAAILHRPGTYPLPLWAEVGLLWRAVCQAGPRGLGRFVLWTLRSSRHHPTEPHYYLETLGVDPAMQGRGLGSALLKHMALAIDAAGTDCALETATDRNIPLYSRFGFEVVREEKIMGARVRFMRRSPSLSSQNGPRGLNRVA